MRQGSGHAGHKFSWTGRLFNEKFLGDELVTGELHPDEVQAVSAFRKLNADIHFSGLVVLFKDGLAEHVNDFQFVYRPVGADCKMSIGRRVGEDVCFDFCPDGRDLCL